MGTRGHASRVHGISAITWLQFIERERVAWLFFGISIARTRTATFTR